MPDGTEIGIFIHEGESVKEVITRTIDNWYFSNEKINPEWYGGSVIIGKLTECGNDLVLKEGKGRYVIRCKGFPQCKYLKPVSDEQIKQLKIKEFKIKVHENLIERISGKEAYEAMENYEDDFEELYDKGLSPTAAATAIIMGY